MKRRLLWALLSWLSLLSFGARAQTNQTIAQETFEGLSTDFGYTSNTSVYANDLNSYFERRAFTTPTGATTTYPGAGGNGSPATPSYVSNQQGSYAWTGERVRGTANTGTNANIRKPGYVQLNPITSTNYTNLRVVVAMADPHCPSGCTGSNSGVNDRVRIRYSFDGGPFVTAGMLVDANGTASTGPWGIDTTPLDSVSESVLGQAYRDVTGTISGTGSSLRVQIVVDANLPEITFDNIRVIGDRVAGDTPTLANLEPATNVLNYTEGQASPVQLTSTLTVGYTGSNSATNITGGTVTISSGFTSGDLLNFTNQNGISATSYSGGVLTLSGQTSQANYQTALRSITFSNSNTSTLPSGTRQITFQVSNGSARSNTPVRNLNVTAVLNGPAALPYTENFDSDGEGTRYFGNSFVRSVSTVGFFRSTTSPAYSGSDKIGDLTYTGWSGGYWYGEGTKINSAAGSAVQLAPVNAAGATGLKFVVAVGSSSAQSAGSSYNWDAADYFKLYYRTGGSSGTWTEFGSFLPDANGTLRRGGNTDSVAVGTALRYFTFPLPAAAAVNGVDFQLLQVSDGDEELAFDNIRIVGQTTVNSIVRASANPTNATTVNYTVTFGAAVTGLTASNFSLTTTGTLSGATVGTPVQGSGNTWTVPVTTGTGSGTLTLNLANDNNLSADISTPLPFAGEAYNIDKTAPAAPVVTAPANNSFVNTTTPTISGTAEAGSTVTVREGTTVLGTATATGGSWSLTSATLGQGSHTIAATATDAAGNVSTASASVTFTVDTVVPTVSSINRQTPAAATTNATSLTFRVTFSENVTGVDANDFTFITTAGSVSSTGKTVVTVTASSVYDVTVSGVSGTGTVRLDLNASGTGIVDAAGNASSGGYTSSQTYTIDQTAPTVTSFSSSTGTSGSTTTATTFNFSVSFSEDVTGFASTGITVTNGSVTSGPTGSGSGPYTFTVTPTTAGTATTVRIAANAAQDAVGNNSQASASTYSLTLQQPLVATSRSVTVQLDANGNGTLQANSGTSGVNNGSTGPGTLTYTIQKIVYGLIPERAAPLTLTTPNGANFSQIRFASYGTPTDNGSGNYSLGPCNAANSLAAAQNAYVGRSSGSLYASNTDTRNNPVLGDPCGGTPKALAVQAAYSADAASLTYNCTEAGQTQYVLLSVSNGSTTSTSVAQVTVNPSPTISISSVSPNPAQRGATITVSGSNLGGIGSTVTVNGASATVSGLSASGFTFVVPNTATIGAGNLTLTAPCSQTLNTAFTVQQLATAAPVLSNVSGNTVNGQPTFSGTAPAGSTVVITIVRTGNPNTTVTTTALGNGTFSVVSSQLAIGSYTATATAQTSGSTVSAASNQVSFVVPTTGPTVVLTSAALNPTTVAPIPVQVKFSRNVFNFSASGVTVSNSGGTAVISNFTVVDGKTYTFDVTPSATGLITVNVPAGAAQDSLSRTNQAATALTRQYNQPATAAPVITAPTNNSFTNQDVTISGTAPAGSAVTLYLSQNGGAFQPASPITATAGGTFSIGPLTFPDATYQVYATAQSPGGAAVSANSSTITFTVDTSRPSVTISSTAGASGGNTSTSPIPFSVSFSENVNGSFVQGDLSVSGGTVSGFSGSGTGPYTFTMTPSGIGSIVSVNVQANVAQDAAGNFNTAAPAAYTLRYAPALTATVFTTSGSPTSTSPIPFSVSFSQSVGTTFVASDVTATGGAVNTASFGGSGAGPYTFTVTPNTASSTVTVSLTANVAQDAATTGNSASNSVSVQFQAPTITVAPASLPGGTQGTAYSTTFTASGGSGTYTYALTGTPIPGLTLTGATLSGTPTASGSYTFTITATDNSAAPGPYSGARSYTVAIAAPVVTAVGWTGSVSTDWFNASNWSPTQVPDATIDAVIPTSPSGNRFPIIAANAAQANARNVSIATGAALSMSANTLSLAANLTINGVFNGFVGSGGAATGGTVVLGGSAAATIGGTGSANFWNLTVGPNGTQSTLTGGASVRRVLALNGNLTAGQSFTLVSDANGTALVANNGSAVVNGNLTVQRYIAPDLNPNLGYRHFSAPVSSATVSSLATSGFSPVVNPAYNSSATPTLVTPFPTIYGYDQSRLATTTNNLPSFDKGWFSPNATSDPLTVGLGYTVNLAANQTFSLTGPQNNGNVPLSFSRNAGTPTDLAGWQLIGNPYPSPLDWSQVQDAERPGLDRAMYVFASNNPSNPYVGTYGFYNNGVGNISPVVPLGQGFFVRVTAGQTAASLTFKNTHRVTTYANPTYHRTTAETRPLVQLTLRGAAAGTATDEAFVYFENGATAGVDAQYDAVKLANSTGLNLASFAVGQQLAINGLPTGSATAVTVPLFIGLPATGTYTLNAAQVLNFTAGAQPYLRDLQLGTLTDLSVTPTYTFTMNAANTTPRFELVFGPAQVLGTASAALAAQVAVFPNPASKAVFVELPASLRRVAVTAALVDAVGRVVLTQALPAGLTTHTLPLANVATGVYSLRLQTSAGVVVKKLVVE